ncbi:tRNA preQ1(34) S-adenosylmethionine ribosyltransferase-isomerase QueA [Helicobacter sp. T3_23-1056]
MNDIDYALSSYDYDLPSELIATYPASPKENARLLVYERASGKILHSTFGKLLDFIPAQTTIILNDTRVLKARIYGTRFCQHSAEKNQNNENTQQNGGKREILFHRFLTPQESNLQEICKNIDFAPKSSTQKSCVPKSSTPTPSKPTSHAPKPYALCQTKGRLTNGDKLRLPNGYEARILATLENGYKIISFHHAKNAESMSKTDILQMLESIGHIPLPPYIKRDDEALDEGEYQSVFASKNGSIAAPTASLHFSTQMLQELKSRFSTAMLTLHIGAGTFAPVVASDIRAHKMHKEMLTIPTKTQEIIHNANKILCVGSSSMRGVECYTMALQDFRKSNNLQDFKKSINMAKNCQNLTQDFITQCDIFLHPQNPPKKTDFLLTNFHLPKSTLIMLVASMVGANKWRKIYDEAIARQYKFYSYGDAMLIL